MVYLFSLLSVRLMQFSCLEHRDLAKGASSACLPPRSAAERKAKQRQEQRATELLPRRWVAHSSASPEPSPLVSRMNLFKKRWHHTLLGGVKLICLVSKQLLHPLMLAGCLPAKTGLPASRVWCARSQNSRFPVESFWWQNCFVAIGDDISCLSRMGII